ncbi:hypothetical protein [Sorangium sp. So ce204]|uniref:hypothetical protein n=1 Tax=Sorangium sp. So ce204 TaxID=3133288 RepID=UPI003F60A9ED
MAMPWRSCDAAGSGGIRAAKGRLRGGSAERARALLERAPRVCQMGGESCPGLKKPGRVARGMAIPRAFILRCSRPSAHFIDTFTLALPLL